MIGFEINLHGKTCIFHLHEMLHAQQTFVDSSTYRPVVLDNRKQNPAFRDYVLMDEFVKDVNNQLGYLRQNYTSIELSEVHFRSACEYVCNMHINAKGRLFITDLFSYVDIYAWLVKSYFQVNDYQIQSYYISCVKYIGRKYNSSIKCPTPFGAMTDFNFWAQTMGIN